MMPRLAGAMLTIAVHCLGGGRRQWARAMQVEFEAARADGKALTFAAGCLIAGLRELPRHEEGRFAIASHLFALVVAVPLAALMVSGVLTGFPASYLAEGGVHVLLETGIEQQPYLNDSNRSAVPSLALLLLLLAGLNLRMAWLTLDRDWTGLIAAGALSAGATAALFIFSAVVFADSSAAVAQVAALTVQLTAATALARWHARLSGTWSEVPIG